MVFASDGGAPAPPFAVAESPWLLWRGSREAASLGVLVNRPSSEAPNAPGEASTAAVSNKWWWLPPVVVDEVGGW